MHTHSLSGTCGPNVISLCRITGVTLTAIRVLQLHPLEETFWVQAAFWEYRQNQNVLAARALLQRAIRTVPNCQWTWLEYARLELLYWKKIKDRLELMGVEAAALVGSSLFMPSYLRGLSAHYEMPRCAMRST